MQAFSGYLILAALIAAMLVIVRLIHRFTWTSYPTLEQYLTAHPDCARPGGAVCSVCGTPATRGPASGHSAVYRCIPCAADLYRGA